MLDARVNRRGFLTLIGTAGAAGLLAYAGRGLQAADAFPVTKTAAQWQQQLTPAQYNVLREQGTERPRSSPLDHFYEKGRYDCVACDQHLFASDTKFDSGTGWPSFWQPFAGRRRHDDRYQHVHGAGRGALCPLRRASGPCLR